MPERSNAIVHEAFESWNAHDPETYVSLLDPNHMIEGDTVPGGRLVGRSGALEYMQMFITGFPDLHFDIERELTSGDLVAICWKSTGTHRGPLPGIAATGRSGSQHGCTVFRIADGRIAQMWTYWDGATLLRQLGVLPALV